MSKDEWRSVLLARRMALSNAAYQEKSRAILARVRELLCVQRAQTIHVYWPLLARHEVDTRSFIETAFASGQRVVLPVVEQYTRTISTEPRLRHHQYKGPEHLRESKWGILEPNGTPIIPADELDVVLVPALGADRMGTRLGHGWGFYDEFLEALAIPKVCLVFDTCLAEHLPSRPNDVKMTHIITEAETICLPSV